MRLRSRGGARADAGRGLEVLGGLISVALGLTVLAHLAASPRAWVLFYDGDSLLFPLMNASFRVGQSQQWVFSSPLFLPEMAVYLPIGALGLPVQATLLLDGVVDWLALYLVTRAVASQLPLRRGTRVAVSAAAIGVVSVLALCESSASHDALEPASLLATTTYYSGTVVAVLGAVALTVRAVRTSRPARTTVGLAALTIVAVASNPLFLAWAVVPLLVVTVLAAFIGTPRRSVVLPVLGLLGGSALGMLARVPFQPVLVQDNAAKIRPDLAAASAQYYASLLHDRLAGTPGVLELCAVLVLLLVAGAALVLAVRRRWIEGAVLAGVAFLGPLLITAGCIALGTFAARYLEPVVFLPPLALLLVPHLLPRLGERMARVLGAASAIPSVAVVLSAALAVAGIVSLAGTSSVPTPAIQCAVGWVADHDEYGAGQYWTVRAIKAYIPDPRRLIQIDADGAPYAWLSNTADLRQRTVTYTIIDSASSPLGPAFPQPRSITRCGSYLIEEYGTPVELGQPHH